MSLEFLDYQHYQPFIHYSLEQNGNTFCPYSYKLSVFYHIVCLELSYLQK
jgi:hypothetical protein